MDCVFLMHLSTYAYMKVEDCRPIYALDNEITYAINRNTDPTNIIVRILSLAYI